jgi:PhoPQ-activated pathogenicity-related protein
METWGKYSDQIIDYTSKGLIVEGEENAREKQLRRMMDPYTYRKQLAIPKLLVNGTNDPYWVVDAMKLYWGDLEGPKYVLQVPNAGHGLDGGKEMALSTIAAFFQHQAGKTPLPKLTWNSDPSGKAIALQVTSSTKPIAARLWHAHSDDKDFRDSKWASRPLGGNTSGDTQTFATTVDKPATGHVAYYGELQFHINGVPFSLCTLVHRH